MTRKNERRRVTVPALRRMRAESERIAMVAGYDATFARMLDEAGVDVLLVGDSLGMVLQGLESTLPVTLDEMLYHCRAVARGVRMSDGGARALLVGDLPFMSYQVAPEEAVRSAGRLLSEGNVHAVKLEGGVVMAPTIARIVDVGIPVMAHVGLTPQSIHAMGGFKVQGKSEVDATRVLDDAKAAAEAGAFAIVLEGIPSELARRITEKLPIPTIGIGAGAHCDGQVLVSYDLLGLTSEFPSEDRAARRPRFVKRYAEFYEDGVRASRAYVDEVKRGAFPTAQHSFGSEPRSPAPA